jgi:hypothetical protein
VTEYSKEAESAERAAFQKQLDDYATFRIGMFRHEHRSGSASYCLMQKQAEAIADELWIARAATGRQPEHNRIADDSLDNLLGFTAADNARQVK